MFACGRYEGIDQRVLDHAASRGEVVEVSLGDYVLNGGEVAALAITEAVVRLLPGFMGNAESLVEESHEGGLLEYPVYTKPASWRGLDVPDVLLSRRPRPDRRVAPRPGRCSARWRGVPTSCRPARPRGSGPSSRPTRADAGELLTLQRACWLQEAIANEAIDGIPALHESLEDVVAWLEAWTSYVVRVEGRLVGAVRGRLDGDAWDIGRIMVAPDLQGRGLGRALLEHIQAVAPAEATSFVLFTGHQSHDNIRMYKKAGFRLRPDLAPPPLAVVLSKPRKR